MRRPHLNLLIGTVVFFNCAACAIYRSPDRESIDEDPKTGAPTASLLSEVSNASCVVKNSSTKERESGTLQAFELKQTSPQAASASPQDSLQNTYVISQDFAINSRIVSCSAVSKPSMQASEKATGRASDQSSMQFTEAEELRWSNHLKTAAQIFADQTAHEEKAAPQE